MRARRFVFDRFLLPASVVLAVGMLLALAPESRAGPSTPSGQCLLQEPQEFLKRRHFVRHGQLDPRRNQRSLRFRVENYGSILGLGLETLNPESASSKVVTTRFFGLPISLHRAIEPALRCVEKRIRKSCKRSSDRYRPQALGGFRQANTYRGGEVSNHLFGIAIDIDPDRNPCCGCVEPWPEHPACQGDAETVFERTALPRCWIRAFERYGFYWLGRDPQLRDTMHFEFLGDPTRIVAPR